jgi:hypothetical protein
MLLPGAALASAACFQAVERRARVALSDTASPNLLLEQALLKFQFQGTWPVGATERRHFERLLGLADASPSGHAATLFTMVRLCCGCSCAVAVAVAVLWLLGLAGAGAGGGHAATLFTMVRPALAQSRPLHAHDIRSSTATCSQPRVAHKQSPCLNPQAAEPLLLGYSLDAGADAVRLRGPMAMLLEELPDALGLEGAPVPPERVIDILLNADLSPSGVTKVCPKP